MTPQNLKIISRKINTISSTILGDVRLPYEQNPCTILLPSLLLIRVTNVKTDSGRFGRSIYQVMDNRNIGQVSKLRCLTHIWTNITCQLVEIHIVKFSVFIMNFDMNVLNLVAYIYYKSVSVYIQFSWIQHFE